MVEIGLMWDEMDEDARRLPLTAGLVSRFIPSQSEGPAGGEF